MSGKSDASVEMKPIKIVGNGVEVYEIRALVPAEFVESSSDCPAERNRGAVFGVLCDLKAEDDRARVCITLAVLPREMNPGDLVERDLSRVGYHVVYRRDLPGTNGSDCELHSTSLESGIEWRRRTRLIRDGRRLFRLDWTETMKTRSNWEDIPQIVFRSFALIATKRATCAERLRRWGPEENAGISFSYPAETRIEVEDCHEVRKAVAVPLGERSLGTIEVERWTTGDSCDVSATMREYAMELIGQGLRIYGAPIVKTRHPEGFKESFLYMPESYRNDDRYITGMEVLYGSTSAVALTFSWPASEVHEWAGPICRSAFEIIRNSVQIAYTP